MFSLRYVVKSIRLFTLLSKPAFISTWLSFCWNWKACMQSLFLEMKCAVASEMKAITGSCLAQREYLFILPHNLACNHVAFTHSEIQRWIFILFSSFSPALTSIFGECFPFWNICSAPLILFVFMTWAWYELFPSSTPLTRQQAELFSEYMPAHMKSVWRRADEERITVGCSKCEKNSLIIASTFPSLSNALPHTTPMCDVSRTSFSLVFVFPSEWFHC